MAETRIDDNGRTCTICGLYLPWDDFGVWNKGARGRQPRCRTCIAAKRNRKKENHNMKKRAHLRDQLMAEGPAAARGRKALVTAMDTILSNPTNAAKITAAFQNCVDGDDLLPFIRNFIMPLLPKDSLEIEDTGPKKYYINLPAGYDKENPLGE